MPTSRSASSIGGSIDGMGNSDPNEKKTLERLMSAGRFHEDDKRKKEEQDWHRRLEFSNSLAPATLIDAEEELNNGIRLLRDDEVEAECRNEAA